MRPLNQRELDLMIAIKELQAEVVKLRQALVDAGIAIPE